MFRTLTEKLFRDKLYRTLTDKLVRDNLYRTRTDKLVRENLYRTVPQQSSALDMKMWGPGSVSRLGGQCSPGSLGIETMILNFGKTNPLESKRCVGVETRLLF